MTRTVAANWLNWGPDQCPQPCSGAGPAGQTPPEHEFILQASSLNINIGGYRLPYRQHRSRLYYIVEMLYYYHQIENKM